MKPTMVINGLTTDKRDDWLFVRDDSEKGENLIVNPSRRAVHFRK